MKCQIELRLFSWAQGPWFQGQVANKRRFSTSRRNMHWFLGVLCRMPSKDENEKILEYQRWLTVHKPIQPIHLYKKPFAGHTHVVLVRQLPLHFPSTSFKSRWPGFLRNVWIKKTSFDILIAPACPRHCICPRLFFLEGSHDWANVFVVCISPCLVLKQVLEQKRAKLMGPIIGRPRSHPQHQVTFDAWTGNTKDC